MNTNFLHLSQIFWRSRFGLIIRRETKLNCHALQIFVEFVFSASQITVTAQHKQKFDSEESRETMKVENCYDESAIHDFCWNRDDLWSVNSWTSETTRTAPNQSRWVLVEKKFFYASSPNLIKSRSESGQGRAWLGAFKSTSHSIHSNWKFSQPIKEFGRLKKKLSANYFRVALTDDISFYGRAKIKSFYFRESKD